MSGGLFTIEELARKLGVSERTVRRRVAGVMPYATMGRRALYTLAQTDTLAKGSKCQNRVS